MAELYLQQWVYLVHGEKQRVSPLAFLDGGLGVCNSPFIYRVGEGFLDPFLGRRIVFIRALKTTVVAQFVSEDLSPPRPARSAAAPRTAC